MQITRFWRKVSPGLALASMFPCRKFAKVPECPTVAATLQKHASPWLRPRDQAGGACCSRHTAAVQPRTPTAHPCHFGQKIRDFGPGLAGPKKCHFWPFLAIFQRLSPLEKCQKWPKIALFPLPFWPFLAIFQDFAKKRPFLAIFGHFWPFFGHFWPFFAIFWPFFGHFWPFFAIFGAPLAQLWRDRPEGGPGHDHFSWPRFFVSQVLVCGQKKILS